MSVSPLSSFPAIAVRFGQSVSHRSISDDPLSFWNALTSSVCVWISVDICIICVVVSVEEKFSHRSCQDSNSQPFDHESSTLNNKLSRLSRVNFVHWLLFGVHSTTVPQQWHVKDPSHSARSAGGRLHLNTHPWPNEVGVGWLCHCPGFVLECIWKQAHMSRVREHLATVLSARWATKDWFWYRVELVEFFFKERRWGMVTHSPKNLASENQFLLIQNDWPAFVMQHFY